MINISNLHFKYGKKAVFKGLHLNLEPGHIYGLLGRNGTGKSTLLRMLCGLLFPVQGSVQVDGQTPGKRQPSFLQELFFIPEEFVLPDIKVAAFEKNNAPFYPLFDTLAFSKYLGEFAIPTQLKLQAMSYGQQKKVLIAFGLACNTRVLLMDEPTNGLDIVSKSQFRKIIAGVMTDDKYILISTHQVKDLENLIDNVLVIDEGNLLFNEPTHRIQQVLRFTIAYDEAMLKQAIYSERAIQGNAVIIANADETEGIIDLEMLYKAIVTNHAAILAAFQLIPQPLTT
jgi:ABC-2 type transport system ATP-binding protein